VSRRSRPQLWLNAAVAAGALFVAGQIAAWMRLSAAGLHFASSAHASFFYTLTALHGVHLAGGLLALGWVAAVPRSRTRWMGPASTYWHFMGGLWLYLLLLLFGVQ
jgi:cytochrome c oxidase subunit 3